MSKKKPTIAEQKRRAEEEQKRKQQEAKQTEADRPEKTVAAKSNNPTSAETETDKKQNRKINLSIVLAVLSLVVAGLTWLETRRQSNLNQESQDRATGKIRAKFKFLPVGNLDRDRIRPFARKDENFTVPIFRIDTVDELLKWNPHIKIMNTGTEVIDGIIVQVHCDQTHTLVPKMPTNPNEMIANDVSSAELTNIGKLLPDKSITIRVSPLLLEQMLQSSFDPNTKTVQHGKFSVRVLCRIAGGPNYDRIEPAQAELLQFYWKTDEINRDNKKCADVSKLKPQTDPD